MQPPIHSEHIQEIIEAVKFLFGQMIWALLGLLAFALLKGFMLEWIGGVMWRYNSNYEPLEIVRVDGRIARISHLGWLKTEFTVFIFNKHNQVVGGWSLPMLNDELRRTKIEKFMPLVDIPESLRKAAS